MSDLTTNEAADRLRGIPTQLYGCLSRECDHEYTDECIDDADQAIADERRATVERIREQLNGLSLFECAEVSHGDFDAILDAERDR